MRKKAVNPKQAKQPKQTKQQRKPQPAEPKPSQYPTVTITVETGPGTFQRIKTAVLWQAMLYTDGNATEAAALLGLTRQSFARMLATGDD